MIHAPMTELPAEEPWRPRPLYLIYVCEGCETPSPVQGDICRAFGDQKGWVDGGCYIDGFFARGQGDVIRIGLGRIIKDITRFKYHVILATSPDVIAATPAGVEQVRDKIADAGAELVIVSEAVAARRALKELAQG